MLQLSIGLLSDSYVKTMHQSSEEYIQGYSYLFLGFNFNLVTEMCMQFILMNGKTAMTKWNLLVGNVCEKKNM